MTELSASGRITRVTTKFAFIKSQKYGGVFVPPCAALPPGSEDADLTHFLKTGDLVHFNAIAQKGKNDCQFLATKVVLSKKAEIPQENYGIPPPRLEATPLQLPPPRVPMIQKTQVLEEVGIIQRINETFGSIHCDALGPVFFPGSAHQTNEGEPHRLNVNFQVGDIVQFTAAPQLEMNGCKWLAKTVTKLRDVGFESNDMKTNGKEDFTFGQKRPIDTLSGVHEGVVVNLGPLVGVIESKAIGCVTFNMLSWFGTNKGGLASNLFDVVAVGDEVVFKASSNLTSKGSKIATEVKEKSASLKDSPSNFQMASPSSQVATQTETFSVPLVIGPWRNLTNAAKRTLDGLEDKGTQTAATPEFWLMRAIKATEDLKEICENRFPHLMKYSDRGELSRRTISEGSMGENL